MFPIFLWQLFVGCFPVAVVDNRLKAERPVSGPPFEPKGQSDRHGFVPASNPRIKKKKILRNGVRGC
ncbi:MAG: hypothetical protein A2537_03325 [Candidatus Magasanikbacteria bacterium RIFOXYD2_FULL_36_9]|uniref:Uncharacterized protein n=1 Tax=Candidatus Magasanikbacteria bacterium RIFOXYD2_FULL_36_9 TaxID=1798707 RepID=A0A1F6P1Q0_9BACT|nr:MAG: hypothetical protein A2537_03325 [Candidatus Magasanikbacteria bacterium RIFOXYD2_FULL_36_9]